MAVIRKLSKNCYVDMLDIFIVRQGTDGTKVGLKSTPSILTINSVPADVVARIWRLSLVGFTWDWDDWQEEQHPQDSV